MIQLHAVLGVSCLVKPVALARKLNVVPTGCPKNKMKLQEASDKIQVEVVLSFWAIYCSFF